MSAFRRVKILWHALKGLDQAGGWEGFRHNVLAPSARALASSRCKLVSREGELLCFDTDHGHIWIPARYGDFPLCQVIAEQSLSSGWHRYEKLTTPMEKGDIVLDCGASEGYFALGAAQKVAWVVAIEPAEDYFACLLKGIQKSGVKNVKVVNACVGESDGTIRFDAQGLEGRAHSTSGELTPMMKIDTICAQLGLAPTFIKADLEGAELEMLRGAEQSLRRYRPKLAITTYHRSEDFRKISTFLQNLNLNYQITASGFHQDNGCPVLLHAATGSLKG
jgi:FkbM family methyltransferase